MGSTGSMGAPLLIWKPLSRESTSQRSGDTTSQLLTRSEIRVLTRVTLYLLTL